MLAGGRWLVRVKCKSKVVRTPPREPPSRSHATRPAAAAPAEAAAATLPAIHTPVHPVIPAPTQMSSPMAPVCRLCPPAACTPRLAACHCQHNFAWLQEAPLGAAARLRLVTLAPVTRACLQQQEAALRRRPCINACSPGLAPPGRERIKKKSNGTSRIQRLPPTHAASRQGRTSVGHLVKNAKRVRAPSHRPGCGPPRKASSQTKPSPWVDCMVSR
jgi:hypothetical protein